MSKGLIVEEIRDKFDSQAAAERAVDAVFAGVERIVRRDQVVTINGFGSFKQTPRAARTARNPHTGEPIQIAAKKVVVFKSKIAL